MLIGGTIRERGTPKQGQKEAHIYGGIYPSSLRGKFYFFKEFIRKIP